MEFVACAMVWGCGFFPYLLQHRAFLWFPASDLGALTLLSSFEMGKLAQQRAKWLPQGCTVWHSHLSDYPSPSIPSSPSSELLKIFVLLPFGPSGVSSPCYHVSVLLARTSQHWEHRCFFPTTLDCPVLLSLWGTFLPYSDLTCPDYLWSWRSQLAMCILPAAQALSLESLENSLRVGSVKAQQWLFVFSVCDWQHSLTKQSYFWVTLKGKPRTRETAHR